MVCIYCGNDTEVKNSRLQKRNNSVWRRRVCKDCSGTVTTLEKIDLGSAIIVVGMKTHTPFSRDKLLVSIMNSCKHRNAPIKDASGLTDTVLAHLYPQITDAALDIDTIRMEVIKTLSRFDKAAAVHYTAFHKK